MPAPMLRPPAALDSRAYAAAPNTAVNLNLDLMNHNLMGQMIEDWCIAHHSPSPTNPAVAWQVRSLISSPRLYMHYAARSLCGVLPIFDPVVFGRIARTTCSTTRSKACAHSCTRYARANAYPAFPPALWIHTECCMTLTNRSSPCPCSSLLLLSLISRLFPYLTSSPLFPPILCPQLHVCHFLGYDLTK